MIAKYMSRSDLGEGEVWSWASILDDNAREQAERISRVPIVEGHVALMPDAHFGYGPPVGSVLQTRGGVMPGAVGVDIGCGMIAMRTDIDREQLAGIEGPILGAIRELIPSGKGTTHNQPLAQAYNFVERYGLPPGIGPRSQLVTPKGERLSAQYTRLSDRLRIQFGTLGSGNHFVEVCEDGAGRVWLLLHSGSRGIGNILAVAHARVAKNFCADNGIELEDTEDSYVVEGTRQFRAYIADMLWAQNYAYHQREAMMDNLVKAIEGTFGTFEEHERINCHHNYAEQTVDGLWLTRKGAIDASVGELGIIPGSMGATTHIVVGRGNEDSYCSSPHGAGRVMGRKVAKQRLDIDAFKTQMIGRTWLDRDAEALLDEAPNAYKPIAQVIEDSADLVCSAIELEAFLNFKGL